MINVRIRGKLCTISLICLIISEYISCESTEPNKFLRVLKLIKSTKNNNFNKSKIINNCDIWEALRLYNKNTKVDPSDLMVQSKTLLDQIRKKTNILDYSNDSTLEIIDKMSDLTQRQMEVVELVLEEKRILETAANSIDGILKKIIDMFDVTFTEFFEDNNFSNENANNPLEASLNATLDATNDMPLTSTKATNEEEKKKEYSIILDKHYKVSFGRSFSSDSATSGDENNSKKVKNNRFKWLKLNKSTGQDSRSSINSFTSIDSNSKNYSSKNSTKMDKNVRDSTLKGYTNDGYTSDDETELYELIESLVYGSGRLRLLLGGFDMIDEKAQGVFSRISWKLSESLNKTK